MAIGLLRQTQTNKTCGSFIAKVVVRINETGNI